MAGLKLLYFGKFDGGSPKVFSGKKVNHYTHLHVMRLDIYYLIIEPYVE